jgi:RNA polymerase sigma-70 factor, ECF subfamily
VTTKLDGFDRLVEPFRAELLAYCYRMLGSPHAAEDLVQDTYLRAWRAREQYDETRSSLRTWLYRIATNACLIALEVRGRRPLPAGLVAASDPLGPLVRGENVAWLQPLPDSLLDAGDPAGTVIDRSSLRLAFVAALQHLSARQRGALILRDVLSFSASEAAEILGTAVVSVNSSGLGQRPAWVRCLSARRCRIRAAHAPDLHRHRRGHQPEFGVPGFRGLRVFRSGGRTRHPGTGSDC